MGDSGLDGIGSGCCQVKRSGPVKVWTGEVYEERCIRRVIPGQNSVDRVGRRIAHGVWFIEERFPLLESCMYIHVSCVCIVASETYPPPKADGKENCKKKRPQG